MLHVKVRPATAPIEGKWIVEWRTNVMPVSAFWTFDTEAEVREAAAALEKRKGVKV